jgi:hypothetical protein
MASFRSDAWLTPGQVARAAGVSSRTVQLWCDRGLLRCEKLPSGHRRIPADAWAAFQAPGSGEPSQDLAIQIRFAESPQAIMALLLGRQEV